MNDEYDITIFESDSGDFYGEEEFATRYGNKIAEVLANEQYDNKSFDEIEEVVQRLLEEEYDIYTGKVIVKKGKKAETKLEMNNLSLFQSKNKIALDDKGVKE